MVRPCAGVRNTHLAAGSLTAVTVKHEQVPVEWVSPAVVATNGATVGLGLAHYNTGRGRRRAIAQAEATAKHQACWNASTATLRLQTTDPQVKRPAGPGSPDPHDPVARPAADPEGVPSLAVPSVSMGGAVVPLQAASSPA